MAVPKSVVKLDKNGITYTSSVDRVNHTMAELSRRALMDTGRYLAKMTRKNYYLKFKRQKGRTAKGIGYWVRKIEKDLLIGVNVAGKQPAPPFWFGFQELGSEKTPKEAVLRTTVYADIATIKEIQSQYLSALSDEIKAVALVESINEDDMLQDTET